VSLLRAVSSISALTLVSRVLGLVRDALAAWVLGAGAVAGSFHLAWMFPNLLRRLLGEGALTAAFVPAYTRRIANDDDEGARALLGGVTGAVVAILGSLSIVVCAGAVWWAWTTDPNDPAGGGLLATLTAILFPYVVPICWLAILAGAANVHGLFAAPSAAPILLNGFWIAALLLCGAVGAADGTSADDGELAAIARTVAVFLTLGGCAQLVLCGILPLARRGRFAPPRRPGPGAGSVLRATIPGALGLGVGQVNALVDQLLAYYAVGAGANTYVYLANRLLQFPHALVAIPLGIAVFPELARLGVASTTPAGLDAFRARLTGAARIAWLLAVPATLGLVLLASDLVRIVFENGRFGASDADEATAATIALVVGLPGISLTTLLARALYALEQPAVPARIAMLVAPANLVLNLVFLGLGLGVAGLALATSVCAWLQFVALEFAVGRRLTEARRTGGALAAFVRTGLASAAMAAVVLLLQQVPVDGDAGRLERAIWRLVVPVALGLPIYGLVQIALGGAEARDLLRRVTNRLGRRSAR
jgi:putative peptidoglycan lipid II flippase